MLKWKVTPRPRTHWLAGLIPLCFTESSLRLYQMQSVSTWERTCRDLLTCRSYSIHVLCSPYMVISPMFCTCKWPTARPRHATLCGCQFHVSQCLSKLVQCSCPFSKQSPILGIAFLSTWLYFFLVFAPSNKQTFLLFSTYCFPRAS